MLTSSEEMVLARKKGSEITKKVFNAKSVDYEKFKPNTLIKKLGERDADLYDLAISHRELAARVQRLRNSLKTKKCEKWNRPHGLLTTNTRWASPSSALKRLSKMQ